MTLLADVRRSRQRDCSRRSSWPAPLIAAGMEVSGERAASARPRLEELLGLLLEQSRDHAVILLDPRGVVVGWFAAARHIFGYTHEEMVGQRLERLFTAEDRERGVPFHELEVARANGRGEDDRWQVRKDGSRLWASGVVRRCATRTASSSASAR